MSKLRNYIRNDNKIRILIDHKYYGKPTSRIAKNDQTEHIIKSLLEYKIKNPNIELIQISTDDSKGYKIIEKYEDISNYSRLKATSFKNIYPIYMSSSLFIVTHEECMGMSTLECNMAGCKVVMPKNFIKSCFSKFLDKIVFEPILPQDKNNLKEKLDINWNKILLNLNPIKTREKVLKYNYYNAIDNIFKRFII